ncbi:hypothetical protein ACEUDB_21620 [Aeromonas hydrophila]|uniref:hypothetical protein n=1 Tax=Aeromonas hydrophila TaxID=644 RepID=UPI0038D18B00
MMAALKVMTYFKVSLSTHNWDRAFFMADGQMLIREIKSGSSADPTFSFRGQPGKGGGISKRSHPPEAIAQLHHSRDQIQILL